MTLTVRSASVTGATTASRALTFAEMDANWAHVIQSANQNFLPSGAGASATTVSAALQDLRAWISTDTVSSRFYRADSTFSGTVDPATIIGYNLTGFGQ